MEKIKHENRQSDSCTGDQKPKIDTGLNALVMIARFHGVAADPAQIKHAFAIGDSGMQETDIVRAAKEVGFKAKAVSVAFEKLSKLQYPVIAEIKTNGQPSSITDPQKTSGDIKEGNGREAIGERQYVIFAKAENGKILTLHPAETTPRILTQEEVEKIWTGKLILLSQRGFLNKDEAFGLKWFLPSIWKYRKPLVEVLIASLVLQIFALVTPIFTQVIIDKVLVHRGLTTLDVLAFGLLAIALFEATLNILRTYVFTHTTSRIDVNLSTRLFRHLFALPLRYFEVRRVGDTIARVRELENIRHFLTGSPLTLVLDLMFIFIFVAVMLFYSVKLTLAALVALPLFAALSYLITPMLRHRLGEKFNRGADAQSYLVEAVSGVQTVKSFALEPEAQKKWEGLLSKYIASSFKTYQLSGIAGAIGTFINRSSYLVILWYGAHLVIEGDLTVGMLIAFQMLSGRVSDPVLRLVQMWQDFQQIGISLQRLGDIFNSKPEPSMDSSKTRLPAVKGHIRLEGVRFRYRVDGSEILRNVSFEIAAGTTLGIVGRSGSGKSTLAKLLQRLYIPESGRILIDGIDIALADPAWLRRQIGVVLQENFLFNASVRDNIAIHYPSATMDEVVRVAQLAGSHEFILELPEGYDTMVGEKGTALSGGQRQRIAIARALLTDPRLLIFDEATSALDYESESIIQKNLNDMCRGRTVLIIAHRLSTLRHANKIIVVDRGEIVEHGSHEELLARAGLYHHLYSQQQRGSV